MTVIKIRYFPGCGPTLRPGYVPAHLADAWRAELAEAEAKLAAELKEAARISSEAVKCAHRIDALRMVVDRKSAKLQRFTP